MRWIALLAALLAALAAFSGPCLAASWYDDCPLYSDPSDGTGPWVTGTPASQKVDATKLAAGVKMLAADKDIFSIVLIRNNVLIHESYYHGATKATAANVHSKSKSMLSAAGCIAVDSGLIPSLQTPVSKLIPKYFAKYAASDVRNTITLEHLLTHTSGLRWSEDSTEYTIERKTNWVQQILDQGMATNGGRRSTTTVKPGEVFNYSTGNSHLVSAVLQAVTGMSTEKFVNAKILAPLGAETEHWGKDPEGISCGGFNTYLTPREMAAFGLLFLNHGKNQKGQQVIPDWAVDACFTSHKSGYGLFWWSDTMSRCKVWQAWGWGSQMVYVIPDKNVVFVMTADTRKNGSESPHEKFVEKYLIPACK